MVKIKRKLISLDNLDKLITLSIVGGSLISAFGILFSRENVVFLGFLIMLLSGVIIFIYVLVS